MTQNDQRTSAEWNGDIAHRTMERLHTLHPDLSTLATQCKLLRNYAAEQNMPELSEQLDDLAARAESFASDAEQAVRLVIAHTGREKQPYHLY